MSVVEKAKPVVPGPRIWPLGVKAYHTLGELGLIPEQTELLYGQIYHKVSKSPLHSGLMLRLLRLLQAVLPQDVHVRPKQPLTCGNSEPEPDLAVVLGREEDFWREHPHTAELVIEICVSTYEFDRSKLRAYASAGVKECWLVLAPEQQIEVYCQPQGEHYAEHAVHKPGERVTCTAVPSITVDLEDLFAV